MLIGVSYIFNYIEQYHTKNYIAQDILLYGVIKIITQLLRYNFDNN